MSRRTSKSKVAFERARKVLVGGVNSPVRAFAAVGGIPPVIVKGSGSTITDIDGNTYIDYVGSYGPAILGHCPQEVVTAINKTVRGGTSFGAPTEAETHLAEAIVAGYPSIEKVRFVSSGTEAAMTAVRLARGATGRGRIVKCIGCYHGHSDALLVSAGSGATTLGVPSSPGVPPGATADTLLVEFNDLEAMKRAFAECDGQIAAVVVEPVGGNMGVVPPDEGYLEGLRTLCDTHGVLLIFDEVMTGFRVAYGGAQELYGVQADLTVLGKIIGGGLPVGAVGGPAEIMRHLAPEGPVYQAGTLSGNPVAMAAGLVTLQVLRQEGFYERLERRAGDLGRGLEGAFREVGLEGRVTLNRVGSMLCCFFAEPPVTNYNGATSSDIRAFSQFFKVMLGGGVYLPPSQFEAMFVSAAHSESDVDRTIGVAQQAFKRAGRLMKRASTGR